MTQAISFGGLFSGQRVFGLSNLTGTHSMAANCCAAAPNQNRKSPKLSDMAKAIRAGQNKNIIKFKGTKEELTKYLSYKVSSGELNIQAKPYNKTIRTADGKLYKVSITPDADMAILAKGFSGNNTARIVLTNIPKNKKIKVSKHSQSEFKFSYNPNEFKNNPYTTKEYAAMKQRFGTNI